MLTRVSLRLIVWDEGLVILGYPNDQGFLFLVQIGGGVVVGAFVRESHVVTLDTGIYR